MSRFCLSLKCSISIFWNRSQLQNIILVVQKISQRGWHYIMLAKYVRRKTEDRGRWYIMKFLRNYRMPENVSYRWKNGNHAMRWSDYSEHFKLSYKIEDPRFLRFGGTEMRNRENSATMPRFRLMWHRRLSRDARSRDVPILSKFEMFCFFPLQGESCIMEAWSLGDF